MTLCKPGHSGALVGSGASSWANNLTSLDLSIPLSNTNRIIMPNLESLCDC